MPIIIYLVKLGGTAKDTINIGSNPVAGSVSTDTYINPASSDLKRKRKEEEKERKEELRAKETKKIYLGFTKCRPRTPPSIALAGLIVYISRAFLLSKRTRKSARTKNAECA